MAFGRFSRIARLALLGGLVAVLAGCQMVVYSGLTQREANRMVATLMRAGVPAERAAEEGGNFAVSVDERDMARAVEILERAGLPGERFTDLGELFARDGLLSSPTEERARLVYGISQELSETISQIDGVLSARIHVVLPEEGPAARRGEDAGGSASVFIRHQPDVDLDALSPHIKLLVTRSIPNLDYDNVSVITVAARDVFEEQGPMLERAMGVWVARDDANRARALFYGALLLALASLAANVALLWPRFARGGGDGRPSGAASRRLFGRLGGRADRFEGPGA